MRLLISTTTTTTAGTAVQLRTGGTDSNTRVMAFQVKGRAGNAATVYFGHSSAMSTAGSVELSSATVFPANGLFTCPTVGDKQGGIPLAQFWMNSTSTAAILESILIVTP